MKPFHKFFTEAITFTEAPNHIAGDLPVSSQTGDIKTSQIMSITSLTHRSKHLSDIHIDGLESDLSLYQRDLGNGYILILGMIPYDENYAVCIFSLKLIKYDINGLTNVWKVETVFTHEPYQALGIARSVYGEIVNIDKIILSDDTQYDGAVALWKRLAVHADSLNVQVKVYDMRSRTFIVGNNGSDIYDGDNIPDDTIWSEVGKSHIRLLLIPK